MTIVCCRAKAIVATSMNAELDIVWLPVICRAAGEMSDSFKTRAVLVGEALTMKQRLNLITLGVADIERARRFYTDIGWSPGHEPDGEVIFFQAGEMIVALWDRAKLAADSCVEGSPGWGGVTLAVCLEGRADVDAVTEEARRAGARVGREPAETAWGGYSSVIIDPDGHPWEIAHNPGFTLTEDGGVRL